MTSVKEVPTEELVRLREAAAEIARLRAELDAAREDTAMYRWIIRHPHFLGYEHDVTPDEIGRAVRAAMKREGGE